MLRDKHGWIRAKTAGNLSLGVPGNRFCDFLADPDSRSFRRFYTNMIRSRYLLSAAWRPAEHVLFLNLSCVCPEPVLVNRSFQNKKIGSRKGVLRTKDDALTRAEQGAAELSEFHVNVRAPGHPTVCAAALPAASEKKESDLAFRVFLMFVPSLSW